MTRQQKYKIQTIARYIILIAVGLVMIYPMIWMVGASFKATNAEIFGSIGFIPKEFTLDGYKTAGSPVPISLADIWSIPINLLYQR